MGFVWDIDTAARTKRGMPMANCCAGHPTPPPSPKPQPHPAKVVDGWSVVSFPIARLSCSTTPKTRQLIFSHGGQIGRLPFLPPSTANAVCQLGWTDTTSEAWKKNLLSRRLYSTFLSTEKKKVLE